jgi:phytoene dehydrogenase-like protein
MAERIFRVMDRHTTNFRRALIDYVIFTPGDLEASQGLTDGNIHHIDAIPSQLLWQRPLEEMANYRTPLGGLYLCGSGCHPWGEVNGAPGHNAAHAILSDLSPSHSTP